MNNERPERIDICIPTMKPCHEVAQQVVDIKRTTRPCYWTMASCRDSSAAENRNWCLDHVESSSFSAAPLLIMLDDDIEGFQAGWADKLIQPLLDDDWVCMVSARLMDPNGRVGPTCSRQYALEPARIQIQRGPQTAMPTAAVAFRDIGLRFDTTFIGSGFEDRDFCLQYLKNDSRWKFIQSNECKLVHRNEMKNQGGENWGQNRAYFCEKWGIRQDTSPERLPPSKN